MTGCTTAKLPVILHVRDAHEDALRILRWHPARKLGGVIHCFYGSKEIAELKGISAEEVEQATTDNAIRLFKLPIPAMESFGKHIEIRASLRYNKKAE